MAFRKKRKISEGNRREVPVHIGIIMDGNGRWAKSRGLPRKAGHKAGAKKFKEIVIYSSKIGVKYLTVYAFSSENWRRPAKEVEELMKLFHVYLRDALEDFENYNIKVNFLGDRRAFNEDIQELMTEVDKVYNDKTGMILNIAMNYGGRDEIVMAIRKIVEEVQSGDIRAEDIDVKMVSDNLYTKGQPDPDMIIRPSGEYRISNFLLWQSAYTEYVIMDVLWPDFKTRDLDKAIEKFYERDRRFGGI